MNLFFTEKLDLKSKACVLDSEESKHVVRTLRMKNGDSLNVTDGQGNLYRCQITDNNPKCCQLKIINKDININKRNFKIHVACALTKNLARIEFFIEKAVEIGLDEFTPIVFKHSERINYKSDRLRKIAISAVKQSNNMYLPEINPIETFDLFLEKIKTIDAQKFLAYQSEKNQHLVLKVQPSQDVIILIGPEGDFTDNEIEKAKEKGFEIVHLGKHRLRTETAALIACSIVNICNVK